MSPKSSIDLHVHSTASDGRLTPTEVIRLAVELGLSTIALTDHDTTAGLSEAKTAASKYGLTLLNGIELGCETPIGPIDILGYCFQPDHEMLQNTLSRMREARQNRARRMVNRLRELGAPVLWERVQALAEGKVIGRPHVARALLEAGHISSLSEAFKRWIGKDGPAYIPRLRLSPHEAIALVHEADGVAALAHPVRSGCVSMVPELVEAGLDGLEVYYPEHSRADVKRLLRLCKRHALIPTGGSDFHRIAPNGTVTLGSVAVPPEVVEQLAHHTQENQMEID